MATYFDPNRDSKMDYTNIKKAPSTHPPRWARAIDGTLHTPHPAHAQEQQQLDDATGAWGEEEHQQHNTGRQVDEAWRAVGCGTNRGENVSI